MSTGTNVTTTNTNTNTGGYTYTNTNGNTITYTNTAGGTVPDSYLDIITADNTGAYAQTSGNDVYDYSYVYDNTASESDVYDTANINSAAAYTIEDYITKHSVENQNYIRSDNCYLYVFYLKYETLPDFTNEYDTESSPAELPLFKCVFINGAYEQITDDSAQTNVKNSAANTTSTNTGPITSNTPANDVPQNNKVYIKHLFILENKHISKMLPIKNGSGLTYTYKYCKIDSDQNLIDLYKNYKAGVYVDSLFDADKLDLAESEKEYYCNTSFVSVSDIYNETAGTLSGGAVVFDDKNISANITFDNIYNKMVRTALGTTGAASGTPTSVVAVDGFAHYDYGGADKVAVNTPYVFSLNESKTYDNIEYYNSQYKILCVNEDDLDGLNTFKFLNMFRQLEESNIVFNYDAYNKESSTHYLFINDTKEDTYLFAGKYVLNNYDSAKAYYFTKTYIEIDGIRYDCYKIVINNAVSNYMNIDIVLDNNTKIRVIFNAPNFAYNTITYNDTYKLNLYVRHYMLNFVYDKLVDYVRRALSKNMSNLKFYINKKYNKIIQYFKIEDSGAGVYKITDDFIKFIYECLPLNYKLFFEKNILLYIEQILNNILAKDFYADKIIEGNYLLHIEKTDYEYKQPADAIYNLEERIELFDSHVYTYKEIDFIDKRIKLSQILYTTPKKLFADYMNKFAPAEFSDKEITTLYNKYKTERLFVQHNRTLKTYNIKYILTII